MDISFLFRVSVETGTVTSFFMKCLFSFSKKQKHKSAQIFQGLSENTCFVRTSTFARMDV